MKNINKDSLAQWHDNDNLIIDIFVRQPGLLNNLLTNSALASRYFWWFDFKGARDFANDVSIIASNVLKGS